ncbi:MAG: hypothetical protein GX585_01990 [Clostridiales bacterium]|nr:hypothetical protein [Clostridiales bacterium]
MECAQKELFTALLGRLFDRGLLSEAAYHAACGYVASLADMPALFSAPACAPEEAEPDGCTQDSG